MKITETRKINPTDLRKLCIEKGWYSYGTNGGYHSLLSFADKQTMTTENLAKIANDIIVNSNPKCFKDCEANGTTPMQYVMFELAEIAHTFFDIH